MPNDWLVPYDEWITIEPPENKWIFPQMLMSGGIVLLSGQRKLARKTTTAIHMAMATVSGKPFAGITPETTGPAILVVQEGQLAGFYDQMKQAQEAIGATDEELSDLYVAFRTRYKMDDNIWADQMRRSVKEIRPVLIVLDSLSYIHNGDPNSNSDLGVVVNEVQALQRECDATVMLICHLNESGAYDKKKPLEQQIRGGGIIKDLYDQHMALRRYEKRDKDVTCHNDFRYHKPTTWRLRWEEDEKCHATCIRNDMFVDQLDPDHAYKREELQAIWNVSEKDTKLIINSLISNELMRKASSNTFKMVGS